MPLSPTNRLSMSSLFSTPSAGPSQNVLRGMAYMVLSTVALVTMNAIARYMTETFHPFEVAFFRCFFGFIFFVPLFFRYGLEPLKTKIIGWHFLRGIGNATCMLMYFTGLALIPLAKVMALSFTSPLFATVIAFIAFGEAIRTRRITALIIGFAGALIILRPGIIALDLGSMLILGAAAAWAIVLVIIKKMSQTDSSITITLYSTIFLIPVTAIAAFPYWQMPNWEQWLWFAAMGITGSLGQTALAQSFREADMTAVMPLEFLRLVWAAIIGYFIFFEVPDLYVWIGGTIIFSASTYIAYRERNAGKESTETAPPVPHQ
ncbi:MAG: DMT family transporter [Rhodospirillaceae bacterium]